MKRFWSDVGIERRETGLAVTLDKRALKTPSGNTLLLPTNKSMVASLIAAEWDHQETLLKPHALPMVISCSNVLPASTNYLRLPLLREPLTH
jgi:ATP synthase F1 complex assembly factor 2